jgi:hypothetical protein
VGLGLGKGGAVERDIAFGGVAADIDTDDARAVRDGQVDDVEGVGGGVVAAVDSENEVDGDLGGVSG